MPKAAHTGFPERMGTRIAGLATCVVLVVTSCAANSGPTASTSSADTPCDHDRNQLSANAFRAEGHRSGGVPGGRGRRCQEADGAGGGGGAAHTAGQFRDPGRHHRTRHADEAECRYTFPDRLEHQDDDGGGHRAARPGRQAAVQRSRLQVRSKCAQRQQHHHCGAAEDAQRTVQLHRCARSLGEARRRPGESVDTAGSAGHRVPASAAVRARRLLRVQQHQLRTPRPDRRKGRRPPVAQAVPGPDLRTARTDADIASRRR